MSFRVASKVAKKSEHEQHKLGAVVVKGGRILSTGFNSLGYSGYLRTQTRHAEESAILKLLRERRLHDLSGADLYVTRFTRGGAIGIARPCSRCRDLIKTVGIRRIFYSTNDGTETEQV